MLEELPADLPHRELITDLVKTLDAIRKHFPLVPIDSAQSTDHFSIHDEQAWAVYEQYKADLTNPDHAIGTYNLIPYGDITPSKDGHVDKSTRGHREITSGSHYLSFSDVSTVYISFGGQLYHLEELSKALRIYVDINAASQPLVKALNHLEKLICKDEYRCLAEERAARAVEMHNAAIALMLHNAGGDDGVSVKTFLTNAAIQKRMAFSIN